MNFSMIMSIFMWTTSCDIFNQKSIHRNWKQPRSMLRVINRDILDQHGHTRGSCLHQIRRTLWHQPVAMRSLQQLVLCCFLMMALFRSLGSQQILSDPSAFVGYAKLLTHAIEQCCLVLPFLTALLWFSHDILLKPITGYVEWKAH